MQNKILFTLILLVSASFSVAQSIEEKLNEIETNNLQLKTARKQQEQRTLQAHTGIYPKPLSINYGYFPDNSSVVDKKHTFNVTQSFRLPGAYNKMKKLADSKGELARLDYKSKRKEVLLEAQKLMIRLVYSGKKIQRFQVRLANAKNRLDALKKKAKAGDANAVEVNKARFHLLRIKRKINQAKSKRNQMREQLKKLNGGNKLSFTLDNYPVFQTLQKDSIIQAKQAALPVARKTKKQRKTAQSVVTLQKSLNNPELKLGYGSETVGNSSFKGMLVGVVIPLWSNKNKVKTARANAQYAELKHNNILLTIKSRTEQQYQNYLTLKENLEAYESTWKASNNIQLLKKAQELGKISIVEYFREVQYYYDIYEEYLSLQRDYYLAMAELYKYRL